MIAHASRFALTVATMVAWTISPARAAVITLDAAMDGMRFKYEEPGNGDLDRVDRGLEHGIYVGGTIYSNRYDVTVNGSVYLERYSFAIEFDLSSLPSPALIANVQLQFTEVQDSNILLPNRHNLFGQAGDGDVTLSDFDFSSATALGQINNTIIDPVITRNVTSVVTNILNNGDSFASFAVEWSSSVYWDDFFGPQYVKRNYYYSINGRLASNPAARPKLIITTVPEAGALAFALMSAGLAGVIAWRRRN